MSVHAGAGGIQALAKAVQFVKRLSELRAAGLSAESTFLLLRTYAQGCATHLLRANLQNQNWVDQLDSVLYGAVERLLGSDLTVDQRLQATLRLRDGGCAFPSARNTAAAAFLGSSALALHSVAQLLGATSLEEFRSRCPLTTAALKQAEDEARTLGGLDDVPFDWAACLAEPKPKVQGEMCRKASTILRKRLLERSGEDQKLTLRGAGGPGAGSFLLPRQEGDPTMPHKHPQTAVKLRLCCQVCPDGARCQHRRKEGALCNEPLD